MADDDVTRSERILAYIMLDAMAEDATTRDKTVRLNLCGFANPEIAEMLDISTSSVSTNLHAAKKEKPRSAKKP